MTSAEQRKSLLREQNKLIREKLKQFKEQSGNSNNLQRQLTRFVTQSKKNLQEMQTSISDQSRRQNEQLHGKTSDYEKMLKKQIQLLTKNKELTEQKEAYDDKFNKTVEILASDYEKQINAFEQKVKENVRKIQDLSGGNVIKRLLKNQRFKQAMNQKGISIDCLQQQSKLDDLANEVEQKERQIGQKQQKSKRLDEQLMKMHQLIETMKQLLENMMKEKENIMKQNLILKEKLQQSQQLIAKLLQAGGINLQQQDYQQEQQQEPADEN